MITLHPATVHFPIALLILASGAGLYYLVIRPYAHLLILTWWPMMIGWVACLLAVLTGLVAQGGLPPTAPYMQLLNTHVTTGLAILLIYGTVLYLRWIRRNQTAQGDPLFDTEAGMVRFWVGGLLIAGGFLVLWTGWSGGQLVYTWGVNVK